MDQALMDAAELRAIRAVLEPLGLSARRLAALWGYASENTVRQWETGRGSVPPHVAAWLRSLAAWLKAHPPGA
jgi:DNA-binding transcriptional regulator YiaG